MGINVSESDVFPFYIPSRAPFVLRASCTRHSLCSAQRNISPSLPKQKFAQPLGTTILPISEPLAFQTSMPSPQPE
jgi:hypothetical protein